MTKQHFSFKEVFMFGWQKTKQHAWFIFLTFIIASLISHASRFLPVFDFLVSLMITLSLASISLKIVRDHSFTFADLFYPLLSPRRVIKFIFLTLLYVIAVGIGLVLLVIPGIYIAVRYFFYPYVAIEHEEAEVQDLVKMSYRLTNNHFWPVFAFMVLAFLLNVLGAALLVIGLFVTVPMTMFATAHMYARLKDHHGA